MKTTINNVTLTNALRAQGAIVWDTLCEIRPGLIRFDPPVIQLSNRLWKCAGQCFQEKNLVELGTKFFIYNADWHETLFTVVLPHEMIHQADYNLYGESELRCGHGVEWKRLMRDYGLPDTISHDMIMESNFSIKWTKAK